AGRDDSDHLSDRLGARRRPHLVRHFHRAHVRARSYYAARRNEPVRRSWHPSRQGRYRRRDLGRAALRLHHDPVHAGAVGAPPACIVAAEQDVTPGELWRLSATELATCFRRQEATPDAYLELALERIERINPRINALICLNPRARDDARESSARLRGGDS